MLPTCNNIHNFNGLLWWYGWFYNRIENDFNGGGYELRVMVVIFVMIDMMMLIVLVVMAMLMIG